ncbi:YggS family pyridoxal phosphate-dependent enzyme [Legionella fairfieldensis]|uniref:YggS family pyridoxal phosphate-dependent enzyme n=1 Tax=Legionella fairfieldensis TaxID=45064 RepID=UPI00048E2128|nr:YggS family pyridoxal phosphate-dependent enzyme [Legionella fairfieldensis]
MTIAARVSAIEKLILATANRYQRSPESIELMAVSKGQPISAIEAAFTAGVTHFGENYWQEAQPKLIALRHLPLSWHFIGLIQSNKTQEIAKEFNWVHSVSREKTARLLAQYRPPHLPPLNICLQVNLDSEENKTGVSPEEISPLALAVSQLPSLKLKGLMAIPKPRSDEEEQYRSWVRLANLQDQLNRELHLSMDTLSMGMSNDLVAAIRAGSTILRIGTAIFGARQTCPGIVR